MSSSDLIDQIEEIGYKAEELVGLVNELRDKANPFKGKKRCATAPVSITLMEFLMTLEDARDRLIDVRESFAYYAECYSSRCESAAKEFQALLEELNDIEARRALGE